MRIIKWVYMCVIYYIIIILTYYIIIMVLGRKLLSEN